MADKKVQRKPLKSASSVPRVKRTVVSRSSNAASRSKPSSPVKPLKPKDAARARAKGTALARTRTTLRTPRGAENQMGISPLGVPIQSAALVNRVAKWAKGTNQPDTANSIPSIREVANKFKNRKVPKPTGRQDGLTYRDLRYWDSLPEKRTINQARELQRRAMAADTRKQPMPNNQQLITGLRKAPMRKAAPSKPNNQQLITGLRKAPTRKKPLTNNQQLVTGLRKAPMQKKPLSGKTATRRVR